MNAQHLFLYLWLRWQLWGQEQAQSVDRSLEVPLCLSPCHSGVPQG